MWDNTTQYYKKEYNRTQFDILDFITVWNEIK